MRADDLLVLEVEVRPRPHPAVAVVVEDVAGSNGVLGVVPLVAVILVIAVLILSLVLCLGTFKRIIQVLPSEFRWCRRCVHAVSPQAAVRIDFYVPVALTLKSIYFREFEMKIRVRTNPLHAMGRPFIHVVIVAAGVLHQELLAGRTGVCHGHVWQVDYIRRVVFGVVESVAGALDASTEGERHSVDFRRRTRTGRGL